MKWQEFKEFGIMRIFKQILCIVVDGGLILGSGQKIITNYYRAISVLFDIGRNIIKMNMKYSYLILINKKESQVS